MAGLVIEHSDGTCGATRPSRIALVPLVYEFAELYLIGDLAFDRRIHLRYYLWLVAMSMKSPIYPALQLVAVTLIFIPEPVTSIAGLVLLGHIAHVRKGKRGGSHRLRVHFEDSYNYRISMKDGRTITFEITPKMPGQLPSNWPNTTRSCHTRQIWESSRRAEGQRVYVVSNIGTARLRTV